MQKKNPKEIAEGVLKRITDAIYEGIDKGIEEWITKAISEGIAKGILKKLPIICLIENPKQPQRYLPGQFSNNCRWNPKRKYRNK